MCFDSTNSFSNGSTVKQNQIANNNTVYGTCSECDLQSSVPIKQTAVAVSEQELTNKAKLSLEDFRT